MSFVLWQSSQHCYLLERGVCLLGKSDWSQGPRRVAVLPLSLFLLFLEQTQWSEAQLLGDRNGVPLGVSRPGVDKPECCWRERIRHFAGWMWSGTWPASLVRDLLCLALRVLRLFWIHGYYFKIGVFTLKIWVSVLKNSERWKTCGAHSYPVMVCWCWVVAIPLDS